MKKVELLAPAGNYEAFLGAINAGADAVYLGGEKYGARAYADNFTEEEIIVYKRGRNGITHIPKNGSLYTYTTASGLEALVGYLYLTNQERLELFFEKMFENNSFLFRTNVLL